MKDNILDLMGWLIVIWLSFFVFWFLFLDGLPYGDLYTKLSVNKEKEVFSYHYLTENGQFKARNVEKLDNGCYKIECEYGGSQFCASGLYCKSLVFIN